MHVLLMEIIFITFSLRFYNQKSRKCEEFIFGGCRHVFNLLKLTNTLCDTPLMFIFHAQYCQRYTYMCPNALMMMMIPLITIMIVMLMRTIMIMLMIITFRGNTNNWLQAADCYRVCGSSKKGSNLEI